MTNAPSSAKIAVLDDDCAHAEYLKNTLEAAGFGCKTFNSSKVFVNSQFQEGFSLLILDWVMPEISGIQVLRHIRTIDPHLPVLMLTCRCDEKDVIDGLAAGADDYVVKPVSAPLLLSRVRALLRRIKLGDAGVSGSFVFGAYVFDPSTTSVTYGNRTVILTNREFALAKLLFTNPHRAFSRRYLMESLWGKSADLQTRTLDTHVAKLRVKLNLGAVNGVKLTTLYGHGYRLEPAGSETCALREAS